MSPALRRAFLLALCCLLAGGCLFHGNKSAAKKQPDASAAAADANLTLPGPVEVVGRIIAVDRASLAVVIELAPYAAASGGYDGRILVARLDNLQPTARLQGSPYVRGRTLGARLLAGMPQVGNEVVFAPSAP